MIRRDPNAGLGDGRRSRWATIGILALALCTAVAMTLGTSAEAAKKKKKAAPSVFRASLSPNAAIPDDAATGPSTPVRSTITVGKKFKGKVVADVNVTGFQTTGSGAGAADDLGFRLTAPNGRTVAIVSQENGGIGDVSIGPLTIDDQSPVSICDNPTPTCADPSQTLVQPFAGTANSHFMGSAGTGGLKAFKGVFMRGTWTLTIWDESSSGQTSVLNTWGLQITAARPVV